MNEFERRNLEEFYTLLNYIIHQRFSYEGVQRDMTSKKILKKLEDIKNILEENLGYNLQN